MLASCVYSPVTSRSRSVRRPLPVLCLALVGASFAPRFEAQDAQPLGITAPAPLTHRLMPGASKADTTVRIRRHSYEGSGTRIYPSLWVVNGTPLGFRPDSSIDQVAAKRALSKVSCRQVASIEVLKGAEARRRFGPHVPDGVVLVVTTPLDSALAETPEHP